MKKKNIIKLEERINNIESLASKELKGQELPKSVKEHLSFVFTGMRYCVGLLEEDKLMNEDDKVIAESIVTGTAIVMSVSILGDLFGSIVEKANGDDDE